MVRHEFVLAAPQRGALTLVVAMIRASQAGKKLHVYAPKGTPKKPIKDQAKRLGARVKVHHV